MLAVAFGSVIGSGIALPAAVRLSEVVSGQAASSMAEPLADLFPLSLPTAS